MKTILVLTLLTTAAHAADISPAQVTEKGNKLKPEPAEVIGEYKPVKDGSDVFPFVPIGSMPPTMPGSTVGLGYVTGRFTPVPSLTTASGRSPSQRLGLDEIGKHKFPPGWEKCIWTNGECWWVTK